MCIFARNSKAMIKENTPTEYKQQLQQLILDKAMSMFKAHGLKNVKMDDLAQSLSISKRTLYELYANKEQLLFEGLVRDNERNQRELMTYAAQGRNEIEIVVLALRLKLNEVSHVNPLFFSELVKYVRVKAYLQDRFEEGRRQSIDFFLKGVEHGYFRKGVNYELIAQMSDAVTNYVMEKKMYEIYPLSEIFENYIHVQLRGLCTAKGLEVLDRLMKENGGLKGKEKSEG